MIATLITMHRAPHCEFLGWDDFDDLVANQRLHPPTWENIRYYWANSEFGLYIPVTYTIWSAIARLSGEPLNPTLFHIANLLVHLVCVLMTYTILRELEFREIAAALGAAVFAVHPVQVEAIFWAAGLKDVLAAMFSLIAIYFYLRAIGSEFFRWRYVLATLALLLAVLSKPSAIATPLALFAIDYFFLHRRLREILKTLSLWSFISLVFAVIGSIAQPAFIVARTPLLQRPISALDSLAFYFGKLVWPRSLAIDYGWRIDTLALHSWFYPLALLSLIIAISLYLVRRKISGIFLGAVISALLLLPVLGFVPFVYQETSTVADHYFYLAMLGPSIAIAWCVNRFRSPVFAAILALAVCALATRSFLQTKVWQSDESLFSHALIVNPDSFVSANNLGRYYSIKSDLSHAEPFFRKAIDLRPDRTEPRTNLSTLLVDTGRLDEAIAQDKIVLNLVLNQHLDLIHALLTSAIDLASAGKTNDARAIFKIVLTIDPNNPSALKGMARLATTQPTKK